MAAIFPAHNLLLNHLHAPMEKERGNHFWAKREQARATTFGWDWCPCSFDMLELARNHHYTGCCVEALPPQAGNLAASEAYQSKPDC